MLAQRTIKTLTQAVGVGLHSGQRVELTLRPAPPGTGIVFRRIDLAEPVDIHVSAQSVTDTRLASTISSGQAKATESIWLAKIPETRASQNRRNGFCASKSCSVA